MTIRLQLERMPQFGGSNHPKDRQIRDALRTAERNFQKLRAAIERGALTGEFVGDGVVTEDMLTEDAKTLDGDVTGTVGASGSTTVEKIRNVDIPAPAAGDDGKAVTYNHTAGEFEYEAAGGASSPPWLTNHVGFVFAGGFPITIGQ